MQVDHQIHRLRNHTLDPPQVHSLPNLPLPITLQVLAFVHSTEARKLNQVHFKPWQEPEYNALLGNLKYSLAR